MERKPDIDDLVIKSGPQLADLIFGDERPISQR